MSANRIKTLYTSYGLRGLFRLVGDMLATRTTLSNARLIRRPFYIRGKRWMQIGDGFTAGPGLRMDAELLTPGAGIVLTIGRDVQINDYVHIAAVSSVVIGNRVLIASKVFITDHNHGSYKGDYQDSPEIPPAARQLTSAPVHIEDDVWIGEFVAILPGVTIGRGAVVGTMSTVTRDVPAYTIAVGSPARPIKRYNPETSMWEPV